ncbi:MAG: glycoside hydrolase family 2, partial [Clostridia bacterium]|nr:glycoside hydrolase family 2 [Clostridia bacterium]
GETYFFHGVLDQGYWPETLMTAPTDEAMVFDISQMKELGFNMLRKHVKIEAARWYWHCDRLGMVVWQDMVNGGGPVNKVLETYGPTVFPPLGTHLRDDHYALLSRRDAGARRRFEKDLRKMVRQLYNFPCIGMWVPFNEGWGQFDALRITEDIRKTDPTRPVDHASGWFDQGGGDVRSVHNYFRLLTVEPDHRAFVLSEYGGANCNIVGHSMSEDVYGYQTVKEEDFTDTFYKLMEKIHSLEKDGLSGAVYTQVSDIEEETNGLLTYDRSVRKAGSIPASHPGSS